MSAENDRYLWDRSGDDEEVARLESLLRPLAYTPRPLVLRPPARLRRGTWRHKAVASLATAAVLTSIVLGAATYRFTWKDGQSWEGFVIPSGAGASPQQIALEPGEVLRTDRDTTAVLAIARIGSLTVLPGSVVEMIETRTGHHRVELRSGAVLARVWAPPWHFGVSLGRTQAVDLGCEFELRRRPDGGGVLHVRSGWVHLQGDVEAVVPAGAMADIHPVRGPGTPYRADAPAVVRSAIAAIDARRGAVPPDGPQVRALLSATGPSDAITLVSLLQRYPHLAQGPLFPHTATAVPGAPIPDRTRVVAGDTAALAAWWDALPYPKTKSWWLHWRDAFDTSQGRGVARGS